MSMSLREYKFKQMHTYRSLGKKLNIDPAQLIRYANRTSRPSLETAFKIYKGTDKKVDLASWFKKEKQMEKEHDY